MHLIKETYEGPNFEYCKKEYNERGLLIFEDKGCGGFWTKKETSYDERNRISKINEIEIGHKDNNREDKFLHVYEYTGDNYRIVTYKTHKRDVHQINTYENLVLGVESWNEVDEIVKIREYKFENGNLVSERYNNLETNEKSSLLYVYKDNKVISEIKSNVDGNVERTNFIYEGNLLKSKEFLYNDSFANKVLYFYNEGLIQEEQTIRSYEAIEYVASTIKYQYNPRNEVIKTEYFGRFNSKMYLCKVAEIDKIDNTTTCKGSSISNYEFYTGYYDLDELNEFNYKEFEENKLINFANMFAGTSTTHAEYIKLKDDFFNSLKFDDNYLTIETNDQKNNPIEYRSLNPSTQEIYERLIYHHEYNEEGQLELSLCFSVNKRYEIEKRNVRRLYWVL
jgi:hypothetical protein